MIKIIRNIIDWIGRVLIIREVAKIVKNNNDKKSAQENLQDIDKIKITKNLNTMPTNGKRFCDDCGFEWDPFFLKKRKDSKEFCTFCQPKNRL